MSGLMSRLGLLAALLTLPAMAQAQMALPGSGSGSPAEQKACSGDARRHCRDVLSQGDAFVLACLQRHRQQLSRGCQGVLQKHGQ